MICPVCQSEYRPGFTRCDSCDADLVSSLPTDSVPGSPAIEDVEGPDFVPFCGFLSLDDARTAREKLRAERIRSEILVRDAPGGTLQAPAGEEYWLRVSGRDFDRAASVLEYDRPEEPGSTVEASFSCSDCGKSVAEHETFCGHCGAAFD